MAGFCFENDDAEIGRQPSIHIDQVHANYIKVVESDHRAEGPDAAGMWLVLEGEHPARSRSAIASSRDPDQLA